MFWKKNEPSLNGQEEYLKESGDPCNADDSVPELTYLLQSPYVRRSLMEGELHYKSAALLVLLRQDEEIGRTNGQSDFDFEAWCHRVDEALRQVCALRNIPLSEDGPALWRELEALIKTYYPEW